MARRAARNKAFPDIELKIALPEGDEEVLGSLKFWTNEVEQAEKRIGEEIKDWRTNQERYQRAAPTTSNAAPTQTDYYNTEQKRSQLCFQIPQIQVRQKREEFRAAAPMVQAATNDILGPEHVNLKATLDEMLYDVLCPAGISGVVTGYDRVQQPVSIPTGRMEPDPTVPPPVPAAPPMPGELPVPPPAPPMRVAIDPATGQPETVQQMRTIWEEFYAAHIDAEDLRIPASFLSTRYELAPWLGYAFNPDPETLRTRFKITREAVQQTGNPADKTIASDRDKKYLSDTGRGTVIFYRASYVDPAERNPERYRRLVLVAGQQGYEAIVHEDCPYQEFDPAGKFVRGVRGNPIKILVLRRVNKTAYPSSDCQKSRELVDQRSKGRQQMIRARNSSRAVRGFNKRKVRAETVRQLENAEHNGFVGFDGDPNGQIRELSPGVFGAENFTFDEVLGREVNQCWALGANQNSVREPGNPTATEISAIDRAVRDRMANERGMVLALIVDVAYAILGLLQIYADEERSVEMVGQDGAKRLQTWTKTDVQGEYVFAVRPNSSERQDAAEMADRQLRFNNLTANNAYFDQEENARQLAEAWDKDPTRLVRPPAPPAPPEEKPRISFSSNGQDLNPFAPQYPAVRALLERGGITGLPAPVMAGTVPAAVPQPIQANRGIPPVDQHDANLTGAQAGTPPRL